MSPPNQLSRSKVFIVSIAALVLMYPATGWVDECIAMPANAN